MPVKRPTPKTSKRSSNCATVGPAASGRRGPKAKTAELAKRSHSKKTATKNQRAYRPKKAREKTMGPASTLKEPEVSQGAV